MSETVKKKSTKGRRRRIRKNVVIASWITALVLLVASVILYSTIKGFGIIPAKLMRILLIVFTVIDLPLIIVSLLPRAKNGVKITQSVLCVLLAVLMISVNIIVPAYKGKFERMFTEIPTEGQLNINVYVNGAKDYSDIEDLAGHKVGIQTDLDTEYQDWAIRVVNKEIEGSDIVTVNYADIYALTEAMYAGEIDAMMLNESYADIITANSDFEDFTDKFKVLYQCSQIVKLEQFDTSVVSNITKTPFIVAISGNDAWGTKGLSASAKGRTDVNIICVVNPNTNQVLMVTLPRDSYVPIDGKSSQMDKLTHASTFGLNKWISTLNSLLGIDINYYVRVNFTTLQAVVDAIGGIEVDNPSYFETTYVYYPDKGIHVKTCFEVGKIQLDGPQALGYCRERKYKNIGDTGRNKHQAIVLQAMINKMCQVSTITKIGSILDAVSGNFTTNMPTNDMYALASMQLENMGDWEILQYSVTGGSKMAPSYAMGGRELSMVILNETKLETAKAKINQILNNQVVKNEEK